jgi:hypothetical protein
MTIRTMTVRLPDTKDPKLGSYDGSLANGSENHPNRTLRWQYNQPFISHRSTLPVPPPASQSANAVTPVRSEHSYSVNLYDPSPTSSPKSMRCQLRRKYDQRKIGYIYALKGSLDATRYWAIQSEVT